MSSERINPIPMGTQAAAGQLTPAMQMQMAKAYGSRGGRASAARRWSTKKAKPKKRARRSSSKRKPKFGTPAYRAMYLNKGKRKKR